MAEREQPYEGRGSGVLLCGEGKLLSDDEFEHLYSRVRSLSFRRGSFKNELKPRGLTLLGI